MTSQSRLSSNWALFFMWIGVNIVGGVIGGFVLVMTALSATVLRIGGSALAGAVLGGAQGFVIAYTLNEPKLFQVWVKLTALSYLIVALMILVLRLEGSVVTALLTGFVIGGAQWYSLRNYFRYSGAWILATMISAVLGIWGTLFLLT